MSVPVCIQDIETHAFKVLSKGSLDYYKSGAGEQLTLDNNKTAFSKLRIRPKFMTNVSKRDLSTTVMGDTKVFIPLGIAPAAMQKLAHPDGEIATAKAAEKMGTIYVLSTISTTSIEDVAAAVPNATKWFQLYIYRDRQITANLVRRAERAGFKAIVLTVDCPQFGIRRDDVRNNFTLPPHLNIANFVGKNAGSLPKDAVGSGLSEYVSNLFDQGVEWRDIQWLKTITSLPIIAKGILTDTDAIKAVEAGVSAIIVSNHGGRQIDGVPASIEALPEIVRAVGDKVEVYLDGGIRQAVDIFKAIALGAKMVFIGRPMIWGLAYNGEEGVKKVLQIFETEFDSVMANTGCRSVKDITSDMVVHESFYSRL